MQRRVRWNNDEDGTGCRGGSEKEVGPGKSRFRRGQTKGGTACRRQIDETEIRAGLDVDESYIGLR